MNRSLFSKTESMVKPFYNNDDAFTLIELIIAIAIFGILAGIATTSIKNWLPNYRLKAAARDLYSNFQRAKIEAVKRNTQVVIAFSPGTYSPQGEIGSYQIFIDDGAGGGTPENFVRDGGETLICQVNMPKNITLYSASFSGNKQEAGFDEKGLPAKNRIGNACLRNNKSRYYRITLSMAGSIGLETSNDGNTWHK